MQETQVWPLTPEDLTCCEAAKPQLRSLFKAQESHLLKPVCREPALHIKKPRQWGARTPRGEWALRHNQRAQQQQRPSTAKNKQII